MPAPVDDSCEYVREIRALRDLLDERTTRFSNEITALKELMGERDRGNRLAVELNAESIKGKFEQTNEWRAQLDRERTQFAAVSTVDGLEKDVRRIDGWQSKVTGALIFVSFLGFSGVVSLIVLILQMLRSTP